MCVTKLSQSQGVAEVWDPTTQATETILSEPTPPPLRQPQGPSRALWPRREALPPLPSQDQEFHVSLTYLMLCLLSVGLSAFFIFHAYLVLFNYTTIEFLEKRGCQPPPDHVNRYHLGPVGNVCSVFGSNPLTWWLPVRWTVEGDGLSFRLNPGLKTL